MENTLVVKTESEGNCTKDTDPTTTTDEPMLTPIDTNSNSTEASPGKNRKVTKAAAKQVTSGKKSGPASKSKVKTKSTKKTVLAFNSLDSDDSDATDSDADTFAGLEDDSSTTDTEDDDAAGVSSKSLGKRKTKRAKAKSKTKGKSSKSQTTKSKKAVKQSTSSVESDTDTESDKSTSGDSDEESDDGAEIPKPGLKKQVQSLTEQLGQVQKQLAQQTYAMPSFGAGGMYPAQGPHYGYGYGVPMPPPPPVAAPPPPPLSLAAALPKSKKNVDASRSRLESLFGSLDRLPPAFMGLSGRGYQAGADEEDGEQKRKKKSKKHSRPEYKRVDSVWDVRMHNFRLKDTVENLDDAGYEKYIFHVRRTFDFENKYRCTYVDIKSKLLRECLQDVIGNVKGFSLVDETPKIEPNMLFLYLEEFRAHLKSLKEAEPAGDTDAELKKNRKRLENKRNQLKLLVKYLDTDYAKIKESLTPMLENGIITFELLWALWKPGTLAYTTTYGTSSEPRVFKVNIAFEHDSILSGKYYSVHGKYFEYDGKKFGYGTMFEEIPEFQGARKITSLPVYPLKYHKDESQVRSDLIDRGKKFVSLGGVHYKAYQGIAFQKRKKGCPIKYHVQQSRVMVDPAIFRRINPNYMVSAVKSKDHDIVSDDSASDSDECGCCDDSDDSTTGEKTKFVTKFYRNSKGDVCRARIPKDIIDANEPEENLDTVHPNKDAEEEEPQVNGKKDKASKKKPTPEFTDEEYLIASPVVLGFSFSEKQWLELAVSAVKDIKWNDKAWDSLVLETETKDLIKALVESRTYHAASTIDDVIQGKGKGLVTVLHGPPGTGKTLTAEGISELLKCPLYMVSAGELGTDSRFLESELQKILDICHTWGAILLLDEADVFLEKRDMHNIHRNALVSIFLRQLEYFQGILFLTTNRVETFDEAFQSRIHIALRYENLDVKAKRKIFKMFVDRVQSLGKIEVQPLTEDDLSMLSKQDLNGREIKNVIGSAQDLAVNKGEPLSMRHIRQVLNVHAKFGRDLKGGTGYEDAMRSYF